MATIEARCPSCGVVVALEAWETTLIASPAGPFTQVAFTCENCAHRVALPVDATMAEQLRRHGARAEGSSEDTPAVRGAEDRVHDREAPPLGYDDLLDLHLLLARDDWFDRLRALVR